MPPEMFSTRHSGGAPSWYGVPFLTEEQWSFMLCRVVQQRPVTSACYIYHLWRRKALVCVVMNGFSSRIMLPSTLPAIPWPFFKRIESFFFLLRHPACSLDLNSIENVWRWMARDVYGNSKQFTTVNKLRDAIFTSLNNIPPTLTKTLISSMPQRMF